MQLKCSNQYHFHSRILGLDDDVVLLDIESSIHMSAFVIPNSAPLSNIFDFKWFQCQKSSSSTSKSKSDAFCKTFYQEDLFGVNMGSSYANSNTKDESTSYVIDIMLKSLENQILICFTQSCVIGYLSGFSPVFQIMTPSLATHAHPTAAVYTVSIAQSKTSQNHNQDQFIHNILPYCIEYIHDSDVRSHVPSLQQQQVQRASDAMQITSLSSLSAPVIMSHTLDIALLHQRNQSVLSLHESYCVLLSKISHDIDKMTQLVTNMDKKWKDIHKTMFAKLSLLQTLLTGYELNVSPLEFLYTVALCGKWHPASVTHFSSHWNDQGILRLRSDIDSTTKNMLKSIHQVATSAVNLNVRCRELELLRLDKQPALTSSPSSSASSLKAQQTQVMITTLIRATEELIFKIDETQLHASKSREGLLKFMQFIKENTMFPETPNYDAFVFDLQLRNYMTELLDPTVARAEMNHIEHITGTHLYAYLRNQDLPSTVTTTMMNHKENDDVTATTAGAVAGAGIFSIYDFTANANASPAATTDSSQIHHPSQNKSLSQQLSYIKQLYVHLKSDITTCLLEGNPRETGLLLTHTLDLTHSSGSSSDTSNTTHSDDKVIGFDVRRLDATSQQTTATAAAAAAVYATIFTSGQLCITKTNHCHQIVAKAFYHIPFCSVLKTIHIVDVEEDGSVCVIGTGLVSSSGSSGSSGVDAADADTIYFKVTIELEEGLGVQEATDMSVSSGEDTADTDSSLLLQSLLPLSLPQSVEKRVFKRFSVGQVAVSLERGTVCLLDASRLKLQVFDYLNSDDEEEVDDN